MNEIRFEWDRQKAAANKRRHKISFDEARTVFYDDHAVQFDDPDHSQSEDRFIMLGMSYQWRVLVVSHGQRPDQGPVDVIRIISARKAAHHEIKYYAEGRI